MKDTDIAYIAGLIDGEGYIGIKKSSVRKDCVNPNYHARIQIRMVEEQAIKFIAETLGGSYYKEKAHCNNGRPLYCYQASDKIAEETLKKVLPYLKVKEHSAKKVLELRELQKNCRKYQTKITGYRTLNHWCGKPVKVANKSFSDEYIAMCESLYHECKRLNAVGI